jgi:hypothetical protein
MPETSSNDDATDRRLRLLIGLVVVVGFGVSVAWISYAHRHPEPVPPLPVLVLLTLTVALAYRFRVNVRVRSSGDGLAWAEMPVIVGLALLPTPWVALCAAAGVAIVRLWRRAGTRKTVFAVAKEALTAGAAGAVLVAFGVRPSLTDPDVPIVAVVAALTVFTLVDQLAFVPVIAADTRTSVPATVKRNWIGKVIGYLGQLGATLLVLWVLSRDANVLLLLVVPLVVACMYLWQSRSSRTREPPTSSTPSTSPRSCTPRRPVPRRSSRRSRRSST